MGGGAGSGMFGGGPGRGMLEDDSRGWEGGGGKGILGGVGGGGRFGGRVGNGISGGGAGGGRPMAVMLRLGATNFCSTSGCGCFNTVELETDEGTFWKLDAGDCGLELRLLGTKDGVEATARTGRDEVRRKVAGVVRACTEIGRRGCTV
jgi:hypothetical protein